MERSRRRPLLIYKNRHHILQYVFDTAEFRNSYHILQYILDKMKPMID